LDAITNPSSIFDSDNEETDGGGGGGGGWLQQTKLL